MTTQIALLRAVNVGGQTRVAMADLRRLLEELGMGNPRTLLQSGNAVFDSAQIVDAKLEELLEKELDQRFGLQTEVLVRGGEEWSEVLAHNTYPREAEADPSHLLVFFLKGNPGKDSVRALDAQPGPERVSAWGRHLYVTYPEGIGRSRLTNAVIERHVGIRGTGRNWNTVRKLESLAGE
jgi:uncharacterized protein (DUF1697 family)